MEMVAPALRGFALGLGLIVAIGAQNAFVLERGLARDHVLALCLVCAVSDAALIAAGVGGLGSAVAAHPGLVRLATVGGAAFLYCYAAVALKRALAPEAMRLRGDGRAMSLQAAIATALALTFLNPHVYLDTVILMGSLSAQYETGGQRAAFGGGAIGASFAWFFALGYGARLLTPLFAAPSAWRILDGIIAVVMASLATSLLGPVRS